MKKPVSILIASLVLSARGVLMLYQQFTRDLGPNWKGFAFAAFMIVSAGMLYWKVRGWRWVAFTFFILSMLSSLSLFSKGFVASSPVHLLLILAECFLYLWLVAALAKLKSSAGGAIAT